MLSLGIDAGIKSFKACILGDVLGKKMETEHKVYKQ